MYFWRRQLPGRAVITTDIPGCREAVDNGKSGMLCKSQKAADSLYKAMKTIYRTAP